MTQLEIDYNPIQWHDGMLLMPQHFQQSDMRLQNLITYYVSQAVPFFWGIVNLEIDKALLTSGLFRVLQLEAIMPDGLLVKTLNDTVLKLQVDLLPFREKLEISPLFVYLCVPQLNTNTMEGENDMSRFRSHLSTNVLDVNTGEEAIDIPRLVPNMSLQVASEPPPHYVCLPLAKVTYDTKSYALTNYVPPLVQVGVLTEIGSLCRDLSQRLRQKLGYLQQKVQSVGGGITKDPFFAEIEGVRLKLIAGLLPFESLLSIGKASPFNIYRALCGLAGQISGVKYGEIPPRFDAYQHEDIRKSYAQVVAYIDKVLDEIEESYTVLPFTLNARIFTLQLQSEWVKDRLVIGARTQPGVNEEYLKTWIKNCVIVTDKYIPLAKDNRVLGASRELVSEVTSMNLVPTRGVQLFIVDVDPRYIDPKGILCLFNMSDDDLTRPAEMLLYNSNEITSGGY